MLRVRSHHECPCGSGERYVVCCRSNDLQRNVIRIALRPDSNHEWVQNDGDDHDLNDPADPENQDEQNWLTDASEIQHAILQEEREWLWGLHLDELSRDAYRDREEELDNLTPDPETITQPTIQAKWIALNALEEPDATKAIRLAHRALSLDQDCIDARMMTILDPAFTEHVIQTDPIPGLRQLMQTAYERLGGDLYAKQHRGMYWALLETRPLMRVMFVLGLEYFKEQRYDEAVSIFERMLVFNPNDDQNVLAVLLHGLIGAGRFTDTERYLHTHQLGTVFEYFSRTLISFLKSGINHSFQQLAKQAHELNPYVFPLICGQLQPNDAYESGQTNPQINEAMHYLYLAFPLWSLHQPLREWLAEQQWMEH